jgi:hypothetical protein
VFKLINIPRRQNIVKVRYIDLTKIGLFTALSRCRTAIGVLGISVGGTVRVYADGNFLLQFGSHGSPIAALCVIFGE